MRRGNVFSRIMSVSLLVCNVLTYENLDLISSFVTCW